MATIDRFFALTHSLPSLPEVAHRLLETFRREDVSLMELCELIAQDPALSARVLRMANSARFGNRGRVAHLPDAAALIGLNALRGLALTVCLVNAFPRPPGFDRQRFWCQNLATAGHAKTLAGLVGEDSGLAEVAGLILRSGQLLMLMTDPGRVSLVESMAGAPDSIFELERTHFGCTHAEISAELAARWRMPLPLVDALYTAGNPMAAEPFSPAGAVLRLASVLADAGHDGVDRVQAARVAQAPLLARLKLTPEMLAAHLQPHERLVSAAAELTA
ncbi:HDOD domain-containing protein [Aquabacterium sp.]|uniref:HDOD domain-containing protein n=1 Tax=Aquabacterium sp. TaxID=1872578 RepID=UPI002D1370DD|nr:HDOD domain-containing protein [Aquabacterium sp.]HSW05741.1 HDOD domain-containing protein [Aquabacterium sp.]